MTLVNASQRIVARAPSAVDGQVLVPLAELAVTPEDLSARTGLTFEPHEDELDVFDTAVVAIDDVIFVLDHGRGSPRPGILARVQSHNSPQSLLVLLLDALGLSDKDVDTAWDGRSWGKPLRLGT